MKKILILIGVCMLSLSMGITQAQNSSAQVTFGGFLGEYFDHIGKDVPSSYEYISLKFTNISPQDSVYKDLQKAVYLDMIANKPIGFDPSMPMTESAVAVFVRAHFGQQIDYSEGAMLDTDFLSEVIDSLPGYADYYCGERQRPQAVDLDQFALTQEAEFSVLDDVFQRLRSDYYGEELLSRDLIYGAAQGMTDVVQDPYTSFFVPQKNTDFKDMYNGAYEGIGAILELTDKGMTIVSPFEGSPADKAGLEAGDIITHVDGQSIVGLSEGDVIAKVKGPAGTKVTLRIQRDGTVQNIEVIRKVIVIEFVHHELIDEDNYYIDLDSFGAGSASAFASALKKFEASGASKLIIDVRNNPGGGVDEVHNMLSHFVSKGSPTLSIKTTNKSFSYKSTGASPVQAELVILINPGSASASEILALTLQDYGLATIIGEKSFGKGSVQTLLEYKEGAALKLTTHKRFSGKTERTIDGVGVIPDLEVIPTEVQKMNDIDVQLRAALEL